MNALEHTIMFRVTRALRMIAPTRSVMLPAPNKYSSTGLKKTTGVPGLDVIDNAREVLTELLQKQLEEIKVIPEDNEYRKSVEATANFRIQVVKENECVSIILFSIICFLTISFELNYML